jgi:hypothetical protein
MIRVDHCHRQRLDEVANRDPVSVRQTVRHRVDRRASMRDSDGRFGHIPAVLDHTHSVIAEHQYIRLDVREDERDQSMLNRGVLHDTNIPRTRTTGNTAAIVDESVPAGLQTGVVLIEINATEQRGR